MSFSQTIIQGNAGKEAELSYAKSGTAICKFSVAISQGKDKGTDWYNVVCFNKTAEIAAEQIKKGTPVFVVGTMQSNKGNDGKTYWSLLANRVQAFPKGDSKPSADFSDLGREIDISDDDEIPF